jgi:hypothetical protein
LLSHVLLLKPTEMDFSSLPRYVKKEFRRQFSILFGFF